MVWIFFNFDQFTHKQRLTFIFGDIKILLRSERRREKKRTIVDSTMVQISQQRGTVSVRFYSMWTQHVWQARIITGFFNTQIIMYIWAKPFVRCVLCLFLSLTLNVLLWSADGIPNVDFDSKERRKTFGTIAAYTESINPHRIFISFFSISRPKIAFKNISCIRVIGSTSRVFIFCFDGLHWLDIQT